MHKRRGKGVVSTACHPQTLHPDTSTPTSKCQYVESKALINCEGQFLVPSLIEVLRVVQELRVVPVFLYRYSMENFLEKARSLGLRGGADQTRH